LNPLTVTDEVYNKSILKGKIDKNVGGMTTTSFTSMVNSVLFGLATYKHNNETGTYVTHIYSYDAYMNRMMIGDISVEVKK